MRKTTERCPECSDPLYERVERIGHGVILRRLECVSASCGYRGEETTEHEEA